MIIASTVGQIDAIIGRFEGPILQHMTREEGDFAAKSLKKVLYNNTGSKHYSESVTGQTGVGDFVATSGPVPYDTFEETYPKQFIHKEIQKGIEIKRSTIDDARIIDMKNQSGTITDSYNRTIEKFVHAKFNFGNASTFNLAGDTWDNTGADGQPLFYNAHPSKTGKAPTQSNITAYAFTSANLKLVEDMAKNFVTEVNERANITLDTILVPYELRNEAWELTESVGKVGSTDNNKNPYEDKYKVIVSPWLTDPDAWYIFDSSYAKKNMFFIDRIPLEIRSTKDFETQNWKIAAYARFSMGHVDWRHIIGNIPA
jgi:hypothetical protein